MRDESDGKYVANSGSQLVLDALADDERLAVEVDAAWRRPGSVIEQLLERRHRRPGRRAEAVGVDRHVAPAEDGESLVADDVLDRGLRLLGGDRSAGRNAMPTA